MNRLSHSSDGMPASRGDGGNIIIAMMVLFVVTALVVALMDTTMSGLRTSRSSSGSANALQAADAGVNQAAKAITNPACGNPCSGGSTLGNGSYSFTATQINDLDWRITSVGTDALTGRKRKIVADAVAQSLFSNAFFAVAGATIKGTADSFTSPSNTCDNTSNADGTIGSDGSIALTQSAGSSSYNCRQYAAGGYSYAADGCTFYGTSTVPSSQVGPGQCPPAPASFATSQPFDPPPVQATGTSSGDFTCSSPGQIGSGLPSGSTYTAYYNNITLTNGCSVASGVTAILYALGNVTIGTATGDCNNFINPPPGATCQSTANASIPQWPTNWYTTGWTSQLEILVQGCASCTVTFANHTVFWGLIDAPNSAINATGGKPQVTVFGAIVAHSANETSAQFAFHYDQSLAGLDSTDQYAIKDWREVPLGASS